MTYSIAGRVIDFTDDPVCMADAEFRALIGGSAKYASGDGADRDYAVVLVGKDRYRRYPIFDKIATVISSEYFQEKAEDLHPYIRVVAAYHIKRACEEFGVPVLQKVAQYSQVEEPLETNVLNLYQIPAYEHGRIELSVEGTIKKMADFWMENRNNMNPAEKSLKATQILGMPGAENVKIASEIHDYVSKPKIGSLFGIAMSQRMRVAAQREDKEAEAAFGEVIKAAAEMSAPDVAELLSSTDYQYKFAQYYGKIIDPYRAVFGSLVKHAEEPRREIDDTGLRYKLDTLAAEAGNYRYHDVLSDDGVRRFKSDPLGTFNSLPKIVQDFLLAEFDYHLKRKNSDMPVSAYMSDKQIKKRTEEYNKGKYDSGPSVYDPAAAKKERHNAKYPVQTYESITTGSKQE